MERSDLMSILAMQVNASNDLLCTHALLGAYLLTTHTYEHMRLLTRVYIQYMIGTVIHVASMPLYCAYCSKLWYMFLDPKSLSFFPAHHFSILFVDLLRASNVHGTREVYAELWIFFLKIVLSYISAQVVVGLLSVISAYVIITI